MDTGEGKWNKQNSAPYWCRAVRKLHTRSLSIWHQMCTSLLGRKPQPCKHTTIKSMQVISPENSPQLCSAVTSHSPFPGLGLFIQELFNPKEKRSPVRLAHPWACWIRRTDTFKCQLINCCHMTCCCHWLGESCQIKSPSLQSKYKAQQWAPP